MTANAVPALSSFADWIRATDEHAAHHVALAQTVDRALEIPEEVAPENRVGLANKLERWRYQHLNEIAPDLSPDDEALVDTLDLAANELANRASRPPRGTRHAIHDDSLDTDAINEAVAALDPRFPLQRLTRIASELTQKNFGEPVSDESADIAGRRMLLYAPLYISSQCVNYCGYCGFRYPQNIVRKHLSLDEAVAQARILCERGFRHLLVVGGDFPSRTTTAYYAEIIRELVREGVDPAVEIAPQSTESYAQLVAAGVCGLTLYQETYDERLYSEYHIRGPKKSYHWRLESHDRAAEAGMRRLGLGMLLGLADAREDLLAVMRHAAYLTERFPDRTLAFSLPRIHEAPDGFQVPYSVSDEELVRLYCALRIAFPEAELVLSTREPAELRNRLAKISITQMSAGSSTAPGGYQPGDEPTSEQFPVTDQRTPAEVEDWLQREGFRACWSIS